MTLVSQVRILQLDAEAGNLMRMHGFLRRGKIPVDELVHVQRVDNGQQDIEPNVLLYETHALGTSALQLESLGGKNLRQKTFRSL